MSNIRSLKDLNFEKQRIKSSLTRSLDNPITNIFSFLNIVRSTRKKRKALNKKKVERNEVVDEGAKALLTLIASAMASKLKLGLIPKMIVTSGVTMATPYIVDFVQKKLQSKTTKEGYSN